MDHFIARYEQDGQKRAYRFAKAKHDQDSATKWLNDHGVKNFLFFFDPLPALHLTENSVLLEGIIGFDITLERLMPYINEGKEIILDSPGGDLWEGYKIHDGIMQTGKEPTIGVIGACASACTLIPIATPNSWASKNSRFLIHNPWSMDAGDDEYMAKVANMLKDEKEAIAKIYSRVSGRTLPQILALMKQEKWLDAKEAYDLNLVSKIKKFVEPKNRKMEEVIEKIDGLENKIVSAIKNFFTPKEDPKPETVADPPKNEEVERLRAEADQYKADLEAVTAERDQYMAEAEAVKAEVAGFADMKSQFEGLVTELQALKTDVVIPGRTNSFKSADVKAPVDVSKVRDIMNKLKEDK